MCNVVVSSSQYTGWLTAKNGVSIKGILHQLNSTQGNATRATLSSQMGTVNRVTYSDRGKGSCPADVIVVYAAYQGKYHSCNAGGKANGSTGGDRGSGRG